MKTVDEQAEYDAYAKVLDSLWLLRDSLEQVNQNIENHKIIDFKKSHKLSMKLVDEITNIFDNVFAVGKEVEGEAI